MDRVIDARGRFPTSPRKTGKEVNPEELRARRARRRRSEAESLRAHLTASSRLSVEDRRVLARNLGRAIERKAPEATTQVAGRLFRLVYGEEGGPSRDKKRKRYIRFDSDLMGSHEQGNEYAANGRDFLKLAEGLAILFEGDQVPVASCDQMLLIVCEGASFAPSRPSVPDDIGALDSLRQVMDALTDRITRETDLLAYFEEMPGYAVRVHPQEDAGFSLRSVPDLHLKFPSVEWYEHAPKELDAPLSGKFRRLGLDGFDTMGALVPHLRLARIYVPRNMLCLPAMVETQALEDLRTRTLSQIELAAAEEFRTETIAHLYGPERAMEAAIQAWRDHQEYVLWRGALEEAGFDPDRIDWLSFEDPGDRSALHGAEWRTFWQTMTVDLILVADGRPDALHWGLSVSDPLLSEPWDAQRDLLVPKDDDHPDRHIDNCIALDEDAGWGPWFPAGQYSHVCRGFSHSYATDTVVNMQMEEWQSDGWYQFADDIPDALTGFDEHAILPLQSEKAWSLLTLPMQDWKVPHPSVIGGRMPPSEQLPCLRPLFDAPREWTPAPDGTLASAILAGLAYGEGPDRLDEKILAEVNNRVRCFRDMKQDLASSFDAALAARGYKPEA
ncbi:hypothetical protein [Antarctobacter jejuensis]|uniref:hypothetical protein n=1 Tax=Antarctobacter jejuensis TaxID=1439938 RepID=UPI003FD43F37